MTAEANKQNKPRFFLSLVLFLLSRGIWAGLLISKLELPAVPLLIGMIFGFAFDLFGLYVASNMNASTLHTFYYGYVVIMTYTFIAAVVYCVMVKTLLAFLLSFSYVLGDISMLQFVANARRVTASMNV
jgi:hypothetical protein